MLDVKRSPELQAAVLAMQSADRTLRLDIYADARTQLGGAWVPVLEAKSKTNFDRAVIVKGARVKVGTQGFNVLAATSGRALSGGFVPNAQWYADEFGAHRHRVEYIQTSPTGKKFRVSKVVGRQLPGRVKDGRIAFAAASELGTHLVGLWVVSIVSRYRAKAQASDG